MTDCNCKSPTLPNPADDFCRCGECGGIIPLSLGTRGIAQPPREGGYRAIAGAPYTQTTPRGGSPG